MESGVKELDCLEEEESLKMTIKREEKSDDVKELCKIEQQEEPSEETTDKSGIANCNQPDINYSSKEEALTMSDNDNQQHKDEVDNASEFVEIKQEEESGQSDNATLKGDNQDVEEEEEEEEEEVEEKDEEVEKMNEGKSSQDVDNQDNAYDQDRLSFLGRNRRVRQKNRYFLDFHCIDLTKGARSNRDDYDAFTTASGTRSSNRRTTTDSTRAQDETEVFESRYCRKCSHKTAHDIDGGCQACLYKKIVESSKRQRPSSQRNRNAASRQQQDNEIESPMITGSNSTTTTTTNSTSSSSTNNNGNKRKATKQGGSRSSNNNNHNNHNTNNNNTTTTATTNNSLLSNSYSNTTTSTNTTNTTASSNNNNNNNNDIVNNKNMNGKPIENCTKLPRLDSWTPDEVAEFIGSKGFNDEANLFRIQSVDGISLLLMQRTDFTYGLKIKLGPALKIYDQVCKLKRDYFRTLTSST